MPFRVSCAWLHGGVVSTPVSSLCWRSQCFLTQSLSCTLGDPALLEMMGSYRNIYDLSLSSSLSHFCIICISDPTKPDKANPYFGALRRHITAEDPRKVFARPPQKSWVGSTLWRTPALVDLIFRICNLICTMNDPQKWWVGEHIAGDTNSGGLRTWSHHTELSVAGHRVVTNATKKTTGSMQGLGANKKNGIHWPQGTWPISPHVLCLRKFAL